MRHVKATRYVAPLREGGSLPGLVEGDDDGLYVCKFRGAGQGPLALVAEIIGGEIARQVGLPVPELVLLDVDPALGVAEPDPEIQELLHASAGLNLGVDFLPGALAFTGADPVDPQFAALVMWLDELITNVDRTPRNPNLLCWHGQVWLIDHGAALYRQHAEGDFVATASAAVPAHRAARPQAVGRHARPPARVRHRRRGPRPGGVADRPVPGRLQALAGGAAMSEAFQYTVLQLVPSIERQERVNTGVVLFCRRSRFLEARTHVDVAKLELLAPGLDAAELERHLASLRAVAGGTGEHHVAQLDQSERFHWLAAPASTIVQPTAVHTGLTDDPQATLQRLFVGLVL